MSIAHPKQKQIRLPFAVPRPGLSQAQKRVCGICRKNDSHYTCPRCNVAYCSLACFRDESHVQCSEPFYKSTVLAEIAADPKADFEEKKRMMEMLKRFEDAQAEGEDFIAELDEEEGEEEDELQKALDGLDIENIDSNKLFHLLPQQHRDAFLAAIRNPESEEARELLKSATEDNQEDDPIPSVLPWWEGDDLAEDSMEADAAAVPARIPEDVVSAINPPAEIGVKLSYNLVAIVLAYLHILLSSRLPSLDPDNLAFSQLSAEEIKQQFASLVPFLIDPKSTVRFTSVREAWTQVWEAIGRGVDTAPPSILIRLLGILPPLLQPPILAGAMPKVAHAIGDMYGLYAKPKAGAAVPRKLAFYAAALKQLQREDWLRLKKEVEREVQRLENEVAQDAEVDEGEGRPALML